MKLKLIVLYFLCPLVTFAQTHFTYNGKVMVSSPRCIYVNSNKKTNANIYTFQNVNEALKFVERYSTDTLWTDIYIEPSVYWVDNPDDDEVRRPVSGSNTPYGIMLNLSYTRFIGISNNAEDVVLACNRGQTQGADGNFTMMHIKGDSVQAYNITFGNYCNVDLVYPRNPKFNRSKRKDAIVQAQLVICDGDNYYLDNCRFISRLNLCPFVGGKHVYFHDCYFECTDDALCGTGYYEHCRFKLYSSKPFYNTYAQGATFVDCDIHSTVKGTQYLTKVSGPVSMTNCRWTSDDPDLKIEWDKRPDPRNLCVMTDCTLNGKPLHVPTPTEPMPLSLPAFPLANQPLIIPGQWTIDCNKPSDTSQYDWTVDMARPAWGYAEGIDGAEHSWGIVQLQRGARIMYTPNNELDSVPCQSCVVTLDPSKSAGQGFGSATGQYLDICIKFDTRTLTGYGLRFERTPNYDRSVEVCLVEYIKGDIKRITPPQRCDLYRKGCTVTLRADSDTIHADVANLSYPDSTPITITARMPHPTAYHGFHLQHTGSVGANATVIKTIFLK